MTRIAKVGLIALALAACRQPDPLLQRVRDASVTTDGLRIHTVYALPPFTDAPMPVYLTVANAGTTADTLLGVTSPSSAMVMFHGAAMEHLGPQPVPTGGTLAFEPGGTHVMLSPPLPKFSRGDSLEVTLTFARAGRVTLWAPVIGYDEVDAVR